MGYSWDAIYHKFFRDSFCDVWRRIYGKHGEYVEVSPWGPTPTDYFACVQSTTTWSKRGNLYEFPYKLADSTLYVHKSPFELSTQNDEIRRGKLGEDVIESW